MGIIDKNMNRGAKRLRSTLSARVLDIRRSRFREYPETRQTVERMLGPKSVADYSHVQKNMVSQLFPVPQSSSRAP